MIASFRFVAVFALLLFAAAGLHAADPPPSGSIIPEWKILGAGTTVKANTPYSLFNTTKNASLKYGKQDRGINLKWDPSTSLGNIHLFKRVAYQPAGSGAVVRDHRTHELMYGDHVAIQVEKDRYFGKMSRLYSDGIVFNTWSKTPEYSYEIFGGPKGTPVQVGRPFVLKPAWLPWQLRYVGTNKTDSGLTWRTVVPPGKIGYEKN